MDPELIILNETVVKNCDSEIVSSVIPILKKRSPLAIFSEKSNDELTSHLSGLNILDHFEIINENLDQIVTQSSFNRDGIVFISDDINHITQAKDVGINFIALAGLKSTHEEFRDAGCFIILDSLDDLA